MKKILTISVAAYNAALDLERCLNSMLYTDIADKLEIIVVNDGSQDNTAEVAQKYVKKYPDIVQLINKENGGHGSTINASIQAATGKYYKIVDSDDWVDKNGIEKLVNELETVDADLVLNPFYTVDAETKKITNTFMPYPDNQKLAEVQTMDRADGITIPMHSITFHTDIIKKMGAIISEKCFYVDLEYTIFATTYVKNFICYDFPVYHYLLGTATQSVNIQNLIKRRNQHLHVIKRITGFYLHHREQMHPKIRSLILYSIRFSTMTQCKIYFNMDPKESKEEIVTFDQWLKSISMEIYDARVCKFYYVMLLNRITKFCLYSVCVNFMRMIHLTPKI